jgi:hypothetical protein
VTGLHDSTPLTPEDIKFKESHFDIATSAFPALECQTVEFPIPSQGHRFYLQLGDDPDYHIPFIDKIHPKSPRLSEITPGSQRNMWIVSINEEEPIMATTFIEFIQNLQHETETITQLP